MLLGVSGSGSLNRLQQRECLRLWSSESLSGSEEPIFQVVHTQGWEIGSSVGRPQFVFIWASPVAT